ncbi:MAG: hypothetical protein H0U86_04890 [Chloroflexi bacterium]|nr:hypothetical protein [Chloroflexota bacterium]
MIDDFDAVLAPADQDADVEDGSRAHPAHEPDDRGEWRSEFRSYLDDPA